MQRKTECKKSLTIKIKPTMDSPWMTLFVDTLQKFLPGISELPSSEELDEILLNLKDIIIVQGTKTSIICEIYGTSDSADTKEADAERDLNKEPEAEFDFQEQYL